MKKGAPWSKEDLDLLKVWIEDNPTVKPSWKNATIDLLKLFPLRSGSAIYSKWYDYEKTWPIPSSQERDLERRQAIKAAFPDNDQADDVGISSRKTDHLIYMLLKKIGSTIEEYVNERVEIKTSVISKENAEMKTLLQKLTKVREAIHDFKL